MKIDGLDLRTGDQPLHLAHPRTGLAARRIRRRGEPEIEIVPAVGLDRRGFQIGREYFLLSLQECPHRLLEGEYGAVHIRHHRRRDFIDPRAPR